MIFFSTNEVVQKWIAYILKFSASNLPIKYLEVPLFIGATKCEFWEDIISKCNPKFANWKNKWLSQVGRIIIIKSILSTLPIYAMSCFKLTPRVIDALESFMKKFLWEGAKEDKHILLIHWNTTCLAKENGGARLRHMEFQNLALWMKLT